MSKLLTRLFTKKQLVFCWLGGMEGIQPVKTLDATICKNLLYAE